MTQIRDGVATYRRGQEMISFRKNLEYDKVIKKYKASKCYFKVRNLSKNKIIGEIALKLSEYVGVKD